jgi:hypothetical protein
MQQQQQQQQNNNCAKNLESSLKHLHAVEVEKMPAEDMMEKTSLKCKR